MTSHCPPDVRNRARGGVPDSPAAYRRAAPATRLTIPVGLAAAGPGMSRSSSSRAPGVVWRISPFASVIRTAGPRFAGSSGVAMLARMPLRIPSARHGVSSAR